MVSDLFGKEDFKALRLLVVFVRHRNGEDMVVVIHKTRAVMVWRGFTGDNVRIFSETKTMGMGCESLLIPVGTES